MTHPSKLTSNQATRLQGATDVEPELRALARLVEHVRPLDEDAVAQARVLRALSNPLPLKRRWPLLAIRLAPVGLILMAAGASAGLGKYLYERAAKTTHVSPAQQPHSDEDYQSSKRVAPGLSAPASQPGVPSTEPPALQEGSRHESTAAHASAAERTTSDPTSKRGSQSAPANKAKTMPSPVSTPGESPETTLMIDALRARQRGKSADVEKLVSEYRTKYPDGALGEEALGLAIEASIANRSPQASKLAREYLERFPNGRFVEAARRAQAVSKEGRPEPGAASESSDIGRK